MSNEIDADDAAVVSDRRRESRQDLEACTATVMSVLMAHPGRYVTAGWIWDRTQGFEEHTIGVVLRRLHASKTLDYVLTIGFQTYAYRTDVAEVQRQREAQKKRYKRKEVNYDT